MRKIVFSYSAMLALKAEGYKVIYGPYDMITPIRFVLEK